MKSLTLKTTVPPVANFSSLTRWGSRLYVGTTNAGIVRFDLNDGVPGNRTTLAAGYGVAGVGVRGQYVFFTAPYSGGLYVISQFGGSPSLVWNPSQPLGRPGR